MKNSNDTIGNRARDLPACSAVPQPTAPPLAPKEHTYHHKITTELTLYVTYTGNKPFTRNHRKHIRTTSHRERKTHEHHRKIPYLQLEPKESTNDSRTFV